MMFTFVCAILKIPTGFLLGGGGGGIYCYAKFYCYAHFSIALDQNFRGVFQKEASGFRPSLPPPLGKSQSKY